MQLIDAGWLVCPLDRAAVHHKVLPSALRRGKGELFDPYTPVKNRTTSRCETESAGIRPRTSCEAWPTSSTRCGRRRRSLSETARFSADGAGHVSLRLQAGFDAGFQQGVRSGRAGPPIATREPDAFTPYLVIDAGAQRLSVCFVSLDYPPRPMGGIARSRPTWRAGSPRSATRCTLSRSQNLRTGSTSRRVSGFTGIPRASGSCPASVSTP